MAAVERFEAPSADPQQADSQKLAKVSTTVICGRVFCIVLPIVLWFAPIGGIDWQQSISWRSALSW